jgi:CheY-like chemotaxis protein
MPEMDGIEATEKIRASRGAGFDPLIPIIALTASTLGSSQEEFLAAGMNGYVGKPLDFDVLFRVIGEVVPGAVLDRREPVSASPQQHPALSDLPVFDQEYLRRHFKGEVKFFRELLGIFLEELPGKLGRIEECLPSNNFGEMEDVAHALKGTAATLGAAALSRSAAELVSAAQGAERDRIIAGVKGLLVEVEKIRVAVNSIVLHP